MVSSWRTTGNRSAMRWARRRSRSSGHGFSSVQWDEATVRRAVESFEVLALVISGGVDGTPNLELPSSFTVELARRQAPDWLANWSIDLNRADIDLRAATYWQVTDDESARHEDRHSAHRFSRARRWQRVASGAVPESLHADVSRTSPGYPPFAQHAMRAQSLRVLVPSRIRWARGKRLADGHEGSGDWERHCEDEAAGSFRNVRRCTHARLHVRM